MRPRGVEPSHAERGQTTAEYLGLLVLVGAIVAALALGGLGSQIADGVSRAVCGIAGTVCRAETTGAGPLTVDIARLRTASPAEVRRMLADVSVEERRRLVNLVPEVIGRLDGAPAEMRYAANRILMHREVERLEEEERALRADLPRLRAQLEHDPTHTVSASLQAAADSAWRRAQNRLKELDELEKRYAEWAGPERRFLLFDPTGSGRAAEAFGADLDTAPNIAVVVPGMGTTLSHFDGNLRQAAMNLVDAADRFAPDRVATIAWLGYDAPDNLLQAAGDGNAIEGEVSLPHFVEGIDGPNAPHVTVIGHSYGSVVVGRSLAHDGLHVDDAVFVGSPGVDADNRDELTGSSHVWAARAPLDPVPWSSVAGTHGVDPTNSSFGATRFETGSSGRIKDRHSSYFNEDSRSLINMARIVDGEYAGVTTY